MELNMVHESLVVKYGAVKIPDADPSTNKATGSPEAPTAV